MILSILDDNEFTELITGEVDETFGIERSINVQREIRSFVTIKVCASTVCCRYISSQLYSKLNKRFFCLLPVL